MTYFLKRRIRYFIFILTLLTIWGCSTQKNTFFSRNYHSITTKYNGYFNARENYRDGVATLNERHEDNYEDVLRIFKYGSEQQASAVAGQMDIAYQKTSTAIRKHSMNIKGVEYNRWVDDGYYLIGRSHYFKRDFNLAILTFEYVIRQSDNHLKYKSIVWIAKCYIQMENYTKAEETLARLDEFIENKKISDETMTLYHKVFSDLYLQQEQFNNATQHIQKAIQFSDDAREKTRLTFILAQAYHKLEDYGNAQKTYAKVLDLSPGFQMAFQARINMAMAFDTKTGNSDFVLNELKSMLKDGKNDQFHDQIYYALGQFSMRRGEKEKAMEYYNLSLENYKDNRAQKGITFLRMGEIFFNDKDYIKASELYDSTMVYLSSEYPDYQDATQKTVILKELASYIKVIERQDSLQRIASMPANERNRVLDKIIEDIKEQERLEREKEQQRALMRQQMARQGRTGNQQGQQGGWYFYNPSAISFGKNEFYANWGERQLEDLWRISNKQLLAFGDMEGFEMDEDSIQPGNVSRATLSKNLPLTTEKIEESNKKIADALYNKALLFKDKMKDMDSSIEGFRELINRFPENENVLYSAYFLHKLYEQKNKSDLSDQYKRYIVSRFPETDFAKILSDPDYAENIRSKQNMAKSKYQQAYQAYLRQDYETALNVIEESDSLEEVTREQQAQFSFLNALVLSKTKGRQQLVDKLTTITETYQDTDIYDPANNLLAFLGSNDNLDGLVINDTESSEAKQLADTASINVPENTVFKLNHEAVHFYVVMIDSKNMQIRQLRNQVDIFNKENFAENSLNMSTLFFDQGRQLLTITNFTDETNAVNYGNQLLEYFSEAGYEQQHYQGFAISVENYPVFYQDRILEEYLDFYNYAYQF